MDTQDSEEDVGTMKCERLRPDKETSPSPSVTTLQSDQSLDLQVLFKDGSQSFLGIKRSRQGQSTSPAPSVTSLQSDQSLDRPILFKDGAQSKKRRKSQRLRPDKGTSPAPSCTSLQSNESMDRPILFKDRTQSKERLRPDKGTSPAPSCTSLQSNESMDRPILFKDGTQSKERLRPDKGTSPAPSCTSLQSNESMDRPILFKDGTQSKKRLRPDKGTSPAPSCTSLQSNESMDRPILFKDRTQSKKRLRPDKGTSPAPSCTSLQSNESMDRPILFKDRTQSKKRLRPDKGTSPAPSCTSLQSNESMDRPILFKDGTQSIERLRPDKGTSPAPSCTSLQSNESMDRPILFKDGTQSKERLRPDKGTSPAPSCTSLQSNESMDRPILFKDGTQSSESIPEKNAEEPFDRHISFRNDTLSPDISTLSVTLLTEDHYRCSVCTEVLKDPVSIPCGHSYCKHCIESYWSKPTYGESYACPQCRKSFSSPPVLNVNVALAKVIKELLQAGFSPALPAHCYAGPKDVPCDICTEMKLKAVKTCLTCTASYCETHIRQHYSVPALQRHNLVEAIHLPDKEERKSPDEFGELTARVTELEATSKRLCKRFEIHCNDFPSDVIEMAALGHPLSLGMLYDSQKKSFCQGIFMWDEDTLARMKVSLPRPQTYVKVLENDSLQERFRVLEMSPVLQGVQTGQIKVSGASAFLNHPEQSQHQERATLHYRTTTRLDMLSQRLLQEAVPSALVGQTTATHVIIAVFFGAQAFFVFDGDRSNHEKNAAIVDVLKIMTSTFCPNHIISNLSATEKAKSSLLACSLYIDVGDWKSPVSFDKAVEVYGSLPTLLGSKDEQAVPLKVWLYPLKKLNKISMCAALSGVSENLIQRAESIMEHLRKQIRICQDIIKDYIHVNVIMQSQTLEDKLVGFLELLQEYQTTFQKGITDIVHIKEGKREKSLQDLLKRHSQSPFSAEKTDQWLENKETELKILNDFRAANITVVKSQAELQQIISHSQKTRVMCLTLYSPDVEDYFLTALRQYIESDHVIQNDSLQFRPVSISDKEIIKVQMFIAANEDAEQTKFIAALVTSDDFPEYSVQFYRDGRIASRNVTLGTKSGLVQISNIKHTSVSLKLNQPEPKRIERYVVEYRALGDDGSNSNTWKQIVFDAKIITETCMISDLKPGHQYQLRYIFVEQDCMNFSRIGNFTTVVAATPGKPLVNKLDRDTLKVTWLRAETDQDFPVLRYNVEYKEAGLEGWPSVQTEGPECECTLTVLHSTCYRVRVSAVYEDITSQPSEETPVPVDVWNINLSKRKSSILLEVLKLQTEKKPVELIDWTDEESEVKGYLQCLPYISQLRFDRFVYYKKQSSFQLLVNLAFAASKFKTAEENYTEMFTSVCSYTSFPFSENYPKHQCDFLLDLYSHVKEYGIQTGRSVLPALQPIYQSAPAVWIVKLSERKSSILLEVLKLQTEKKPVELIDWTDEESEVKGFLQCLPYISQLRFNVCSFNDEKQKSAVQFLVNLSVAASECDEATGESFTALLIFVCSYKSFPCENNGCNNCDHGYVECQIKHCDFLLDLYSQMKNYKIQTGRSVLPVLQVIYQSAPAVWRIKLSERKSSILLEVLKLQTEKKPVELIDWTDEESEVKGFLQCLPYISQLRFRTHMKREPAVKFLLNLIVSASEFKENCTELLTSVCSYTFFPYNEGYYSQAQCDFLLDLCSHVKDYETQTGRSVLPALQPIYQSALTVWIIDLSERKSSILLEVLKLQTEKKPVELIDWTDEESEVKGFLQCLPYISQLRFDIDNFEREPAVKLLLKLIVSASEFDAIKGENYTELLTSVCSYTSFPFNEDYFDDSEYQIDQCNFLLDLCSHMKNYETRTDRSVLPALQPIYQSAPAVWIIDLSERKSSILLEVLKLQTEKKPVKLIDWTDEESEVKGFLQCLPYISQLRIHESDFSYESAAQFLLNLTVAASKCVTTTGENFIELLTSVCSYKSFLCYDDDDIYDDCQNEHCDFLLDLCSHVKDYETQTGSSVLPALQPIYQSAPAVWRIKLSERKSSILLEVLKLQTEKKPVELIDWTDEESEVKGFLQCLPYISQLRFVIDNFEREPAVKFLLKLIVSASEFDAIKGESYTELLTSVCSYTFFPNIECNYYNKNHQINQSDFLLDLYSHVKDYDSQTGRSVLPALQPIYQSAPAVWRIKLSERKSSILLEVLKLQTEKKPVVLIDWTDDESEVKGFLQCLPYISQLRFNLYALSHFERKSSVQFLANLVISALEFDKDTSENYTELLTSVCSYTSFPCSENYTNHQCNFLLDLYSHVKDYETQTGRSVLPALQPIYQSAPAVWSINLSERKSSILLEVLKLQTEKKPVELIDWTDEESEVKGFLQCLPYISQLRFDSLVFKKKKRSVQFLGNLIISASEFHKTTGENYTELFTSMCSYTSFPCSENNTNYHTDQCDFLLDLYSHVKDYESQTGRSVLPALQPIYQSAPAVWRIKLSERKSSILLEVLKLQTEKKPVVLIDWTDDESEVKGFLQCLPYISQLRFNLYALSHFERKSSVQFLANLVISALEFDKDTSENYTELLTSVCSYTSFPCSENYTNHQCNFLLDLYSHVKDYETQTGRSVLPALQPIYQSAPAVWSINLSERKSSILLEVLKLQTEKKPVELIDWTDEESEVKGFLQCLPYISQLRFDSLVFKKKKRSVQFLRNLIISASEFDKTTGENNTELFTSMCSYTSFPCSENNTNCHTDQCDFLLDLYSHVKDYESQTGRSVLPALQPIYQSAPAVWIIKLSERKSSILLEVLKLQTEKKPVELIDWTDEESKVKGFLQCLPYISQLRPSKEALQQLVSVVYDAQDDELTDCFLKVSEDLTSCSLTWDVIHYLLQHQALNLKVDFRKSKISCENIRKLLPLLDRIQLKRLSPSFTLSIILEIYETRFPQYVSSLMSSAGNDINLNGRVLDYVHCAALRFILEHCDTVKLNLLWTSIAEGELESFLPLLSKVKQLSVDRLLLLKLLHCCSSSDLQQEAADVLLSALQNRLDFSCCSALDLTDTQENQEHFQTN
ncbi:uncharacterized protein si:ch211-281l24.3 isoform X23 [Labeo rohita]|uniref:uncharacterized protein si:ch211-281l24.3 isoform X23 n=1 Tax=Labeo rohita TaxID=84645 RepID=UPI0021E27E89|nr:uncharacterized protein si:ch211-281l24.3 isoform X23 [Labeo rohita]